MRTHHSHAAESEFPEVSEVPAQVEIEIPSAVGIFEPVTITRSTSAVPDAATGEGFWPDAIDTDKSATPTLAAKATPKEPSLTWGFISDPKRSD
jgi:hypothetical protein